MAETYQIRKLVAWEICAADTTAPNPGAPIWWGDRHCQAWEARLPQADAAIKALQEQGYRLYDHE